GVEVAHRHGLLLHAVARVLPAACNARELRSEPLDATAVRELRVNEHVLVDHTLETLVISERLRDGLLLLHQGRAVDGRRVASEFSKLLTEVAGALAGDEVLRTFNRVLDEALDGL